MRLYVYISNVDKPFEILHLYPGFEEGFYLDRGKKKKNSLHVNIGRYGVLSVTIMQLYYVKRVSFSQQCRWD
jgi:hypothetical protein